MKQETKELQKKETASLSTDVNKFEIDSFLEGGLEKDDVRIDRLGIVQAMSSDLKAQNDNLAEGDLYLSSNGQLVAKKNTKLEFTPLYTAKLVQVFQNKTKGETWDTAQKGDWIATHSQAEMDMSQPLVQKDIILVKVLALYGMFHGPQFSTLLPIRFYFKSASFKAFQPLVMGIANYCEQNPGKNQLDTVFTLSTKIEKNKKGSYFVPEIQFLRNSTETEKAAALRLMQFTKELSKDVLMDDSDEIPNYA